MQEKRRNVRFKKQYTAIFSLKDNPQKTFDVSGLRDISKGGLKFLSFEKYEVGTVIIFQIKFPFAYPRVTSIEGKVISVTMASVGQTIYQTSIRFINITPQIRDDLEKMEKINLKK